ncbi:MAG: putative toxin-antitoxin system toxin component, PIN family [Solirubrobacter sp.]|uniref:Putative toxin-antitoxin system toxin component, PIN family n=1 Tax=Candidatus Aquicultor secundus TaxID=1973895 RepID=A0A2M7TAL5_9ACTN|nr:putative toxin-antitoxin system toxin component, PIN family [Solirubrobacter sp.]PIU26802.1 MAG: putative toxin-antitoxin system toxin component, PIN family [Candidatus Aquicultor secundus]PIX51419.1 MAG: putative toxin-antitoxin system toxin component, PIN family [Candidatus Aquicultor secundus]PIY42058.1 MAG: putative toxin-antitoxin system toxin component, PIN family [Candidatus Aquicultor secundus]PIZ41592.1 MAG: putative toxin-antitoxin system toxin component, PIN family [Candidatus Aqu
MVADEPDNRVLECAVAAKANIIVTGDKHLLDLKAYESIRIVRAADLLYIV